MLEEEEDSQTDIDEIEGYVCDQLEEGREDKLHDPDYVEMDGTYDHNIQILLTFTHGAIHESTYNHHVYKWTLSSH